MTRIGSEQLRMSRATSWPRPLQPEGTEEEGGWGWMDRRPTEGRGAGEGGEDVSHGKGGSVSTEASQHHSFC